MQRKSTKKAFSFLELSLVILVVGILISAVVSGKTMINQSYLRSAQALTKNSAINSIPDLTLWLETTLNESITGAASGNNLSNGDLILSWNDISGNKINVTQSTSGNQPLYLTSGINNLPTISFDGAADFLFSTTKFPLSPGDDSFTFVAVWYRIDPAGASARSIFEQNTGATSLTGRRAGMITVDASRYGFNGESNDFHFNSYTGGIPIISIITLTAPTGSGTTIAVNVYTNSSNPSASGTINAATQNTGNGIFIVGAKGLTSKTEFWYGQISEIMVFDRDLKPSEITLINNYLSKKYNITIY